jgi:3-oxoacyl-[acyl-carrier protein] reductase
MDLQLMGKVALVTGASAGIGAATAVALAREGMNVMLTARRPGLLAKVAAEAERSRAGAAAWVCADLTLVDGPRTAVAATIERYGRIDVLVNNGAPTTMGGLFDWTDEEYASALEGKALAYLRSSRAAVPHMRARGGGVIINIAGLSARHASAGYLLGTMATTAIHGLTKSLSDEFSRDHIRVVCVDPGYIDTDRMRKGAIEHFERVQQIEAEELLKRFQADIPLGRFGTPEELADVITFLVSPRAAYVTGTTLVVDGGRSRSID